MNTPARWPGRNLPNSFALTTYRPKWHNFGLVCVHSRSMRISFISIKSYKSPQSYDSREQYKFMVNHFGCVSWTHLGYRAHMKRPQVHYYPWDWKRSQNYHPPRWHTNHIASYLRKLLGTVSGWTRKVLASGKLEQNLEPYDYRAVYSRILNINRGSLHTRRFRRIHFAVFRYRWTKNSFTGLKSFRGSRETGLW